MRDPIAGIGRPGPPRPTAATFEAAFAEAFRLAFFLHGERATARAIAVEAFSQLRLAVTAQRRRFYYRPLGGRSKVELSELQLLQRLVLIASEPHERAGEAAGRAGQADLVLRFVKHLVRITMKRNSFHVALGLTRVLHDYPTTAAMDLYGLLLADPGRNPDGPYYRSRKRLLLAELAERFGPRVELVRGPGGEDRFAGQPAAPFAELVRRALAAFAPWGVRCELPPGWSAERAIPDLDAAAGPLPEVDLRRCFAVLHPPTFDRLLAAARLPPAAERLSLPAFRFEEEEEDGPTEGRGEVADPSEEEIAAARSELAHRAAARRQPAPAWLAVRVDGVVRGRVGLDGEPCALRLGEGTERIEMVADPGGAEPLAIHLLGGAAEEARGQAEHFEVRLPKGRRLALEIAGPDEERARALCVSYRRSAWRRNIENVAAMSGMPAIGGLSAMPRRVAPPPRVRAARATLAALATLSIGALLLTIGPLLRQPAEPRPPFAAPPAGALTRGGEGGNAGETSQPSHGTVVLWLEPPPAATDPALAAALARGLAGLDRVAASADREAADLALRWLPGAKGGADLALVARDGRTLWRRSPAAGRPPRRQAADWLRELAPYLEASSRHSPSRANPDQ